MPDKLVLALCPTCERWLPSAGPELAGLTRTCTLNIPGAPKRSRCDQYVRAIGRGEIYDWVKPDADTP